MHFPVLKQEVIDCLKLKPGSKVIDCTVGEGGHSLAILKKIGAKGKLLAIDLDSNNINVFLERAGQDNVKTKIFAREENFIDLERIAKETKIGPVDAILFDLGISERQLADVKKGFSFLRQGPLDMRLNQSKQNLTAEAIVNYWNRKQLEEIIRDYGQEKFARKISGEIDKARRIKPIRQTLELVGIIKRAVPGSYCRNLAGKRNSYRGQRIHFATKTFQALRIAVNRDLENLSQALPQTLRLLKKGGRLAVISFQSLEDKIVKEFIKEKSAKGELTAVFKKPATASKQEIKINPRSRSAKLRAAIKIKTVY